MGVLAADVQPLAPGTRGLDFIALRERECLWATGSATTDVHGLTTRTMFPRRDRKRDLFTLTFLLLHVLQPALDFRWGILLPAVLVRSLDSGTHAGVGGVEYSEHPESGEGTEPFLLHMVIKKYFLLLIVSTSGPGY